MRKRTSAGLGMVLGGLAVAGMAGAGQGSERWTERQLVVASSATERAVGGRVERPESWVDATAAAFAAWMRGFSPEVLFSTRAEIIPGGSGSGGVGGQGGGGVTTGGEGEGGES